MSRALGDYEYKNVEGKGPCEQLVSPEPEISVEPLDEKHGEFRGWALEGASGARGLGASWGLLRWSTPASAW